MPNFNPSPSPNANAKPGFAAIACLAMISPLTALHNPVTATPPISDQVGVYALIERVVFLPDAKTARKVRIFGAFAIAEGKNGDYYRSPQWGVLFFHLDPEKSDQCRAEWSDLAKKSGTGECVGFGEVIY